jgi:hypothetical protein
VLAAGCAGGWLCGGCWLRGACWLRGGWRSDGCAVGWLVLLAGFAGWFCQKLLSR